ncbi:hypothetical protein [Haloarcula sp. Atlit-120R]|uniref:DUF7537 family lipoprotein n=1 Tax=Haloarcula sp. Atlit-120R TaxID=2282135 RepID=UPI000EF2435F|nr:hypothetical protein [Haloarcula sp. Atlit-120R]RLM39628.1 hypothetical protein DVK01_03445 [Haloarcula sp. Atlit-120R]
MTTRLLTVLVVSLIVLAGCLGGGPAAGDGTDADDGGAAPADRDDLSVEATDRLLRDAGSFTATWSYSTTEGGETATMTNDYRVDLRANRSLETFTMSGPDARTDFETFVADGSAYTRYETDGEAFYQIRPQDDTAFQSAIDRGRLSSESVDDARLVGTETFDGVTVDRYEYSDLSTWRQIGAGAFGSGGNVTVTDFTVVILVDGDGLARQTAWTLTGETDDGETVAVEWRYEVTGVGSTDVPDPDWLADARAQQSNAST